MRGKVLYMKNILMEIFKNEEGQAMTEYGLIIALVAVAVITILGTLGTNLTSLFTKVSDQVNK